uniref:Venom peptide Ld2a n=1 Tax=Lethocerus distinctifemur TaxID=280095 RepID=A0A2K8JRQ4_9HEMI|nr:venom peptide Ld2a [Lethocerus distinctifemur]
MVSKIVVALCVSVCTLWFVDMADSSPTFFLEPYIKGEILAIGESVRSTLGKHKGEVLTDQILKDSIMAITKILVARKFNITPKSDYKLESNQQ